MRLLITGGSGFIGVNLINRLLGMGAKLVVLDDLSVGKFEYLQEVAPLIRKVPADCVGKGHGRDPLFVQGDIRNFKLVKTVVAGVDAIVHLAAHTRVIESIERPQHDMEINVNGTVNLLEAARIHGVRRFILASSGAALGEQEPPINEGKAPRPAAPYGASKLAGEGYCSAYFQSFGIATAALRFSNVYGPRSFHKGSAVAHFMKNVLQGKPLVIYGDGTQTRDFLYIQDLCEAICSCLFAAQEEIGGQVFQVATGKETSVNEVVSIIRELATKAGIKVEVHYEAARKGEVYRNYAEIGKAERLLGYRPKTTLEEGSQATWDWFLGKFKEMLA